MHVKLDTGMGRWGLSELPRRAARVVGVMTHLATADSDPSFARAQIERFRAATERLPAQLTRHVANSAAALRLPESRFDAARCGIALYGLSPFGTEAAEDGLEPVLSWRSEIAQVKLLRAGESTGYGRRFVAERDTWIGIVPVGYARRLPSRPDRHRGARRRRAARVVGVVSMDALAVELDRELPRRNAGDDRRRRACSLEEHARVADTITYELACGIGSSPARTPRTWWAP